MKAGTLLFASLLALATASAPARADDTLPRVWNELQAKDAAGLAPAEALLLAISREDMKTVERLLAAGVDAKGVNEYGAGAIYAAAGAADPAMVKRMLAAGADPNARLMSGETPLMLAAFRGNVETVKALLAGGANPNLAEENAGQTALMWAVSERHAPVVEALAKGGADVHARTKRGATALIFAAQQSDPGFARALLDAGANPNDVMTRSGVTPLIVASAMNNAEVAALLLRHKANPDAVDGNGFTALHHAARDRRSLKIVRELLRAGAKPNTRIVQEKPRSFTTTYIELRGGTPLLLAAEINNLDAVKALVEAGADPLIPTQTGTTALMLAAGAGTDVVRPRSQRERDIAIQTVKYLVERGADIKGVGQFGWTPLHAATYQGLNEVIQFLVAKGADIDAMDGYGQTPLSIASTVLTRKIGASVLQIPRIYRKETVELLVKLGATPLEKSGVDIVFQRRS